MRNAHTIAHLQSRGSRQFPERFPETLTLSGSLTYSGRKRGEKSIVHQPSILTRIPLHHTPHPLAALRAGISTKR